MKVETLKPHEMRRLREIRLRALRDSPDAFGTTFESAASWPDERWEEQLLVLPTFVAVVAGADVGMVRCAVDDRDQDTGWLISMWVSPEARRHGLGGMLVDRVIQWARQGKLGRLLLDVGDANVAATALYAGRGFEPTGTASCLPAPRNHIKEHRRELRLAAP